MIYLPMSSVSSGNKKCGSLYMDGKKICDGLDMSLSDFFDTPEFEQLEQEIV